jgi:hypothetical protein
MNVNSPQGRLLARHAFPALLAGVLMALPLPGATAAAVVAVEPGSTAAQWHPQKLNFSYSGFTTLYTCDGIEDKVRDILLAFGARKDVKVHARGCVEPNNRPSKFAWVAVEFSSLVPVSDPAATDTVPASWTKVQIAPNRPLFMGAGECELVEQMRDVLQKGFQLRNTDYRVSCVPHQVSIADYSVTTEALKAAAK